MNNDLSSRLYNIRSKAEELTERIKEPPTPIFDIARTIAPIVFTADSVIENAACFYSPSGECRIFVELGGHLSERVRYSVAHEVGHIVLKHYSVLHNKARQLSIPIKDKLIFWNDIPELIPLVNIFDREAEIFAAEILMPLKWLNRPRTRRDFENLRRTLMVSIQALRIRLDETGIMPRHEVDMLLKELG